MKIIRKCFVYNKSIRLCTHTWKGTMRVRKAFKSNRKFNITWTNNVLNLEILKITIKKHWLVKIDRTTNEKQSCNKMMNTLNLAGNPSFWIIRAYYSNNITQIKRQYERWCMKFNIYGITICDTHNWLRVKISIIHIKYLPCSQLWLLLTFRSSTNLKQQVVKWANYIQAFKY